MTDALGVMPAPIPGGELDGPAATSWLWPDATEQIPRIGAHVVAWVSGPGSPIDAHQHLTRLVTTVLRATDALGVYCGAAGQVVRADVFDGLAHDYHPDRLPVMPWIDFRTFQNHGRSALFTVGMSEFGLMELEIPRSDKTPGQLREFGMNLAIYLIPPSTPSKASDRRSPARRSCTVSKVTRSTRGVGHVRREGTTWSGAALAMRASWDRG